MHKIVYLSVLLLGMTFVGCSSEDENESLGEYVVRDSVIVSLSSHEDSVVIDMLGLEWREISTMFLTDETGRHETGFTIEDIGADGQYHAVNMEDIRKTVYERSNYWRIQGPWFVICHPNHEASKMMVKTDENKNTRRSVEIVLTLPDAINHYDHLRTIKIIQAGLNKRR